MSAVIIDFGSIRAARAASAPSSVVFQSAVLNAMSAGPIAERDSQKAAFQFWTGASGVRYVHSVYNLFECPPVEAANYILVKRHVDGHRTVISIGRAAYSTGTLNLAEIRLRSAQLGANEVHIHLLADSHGESQEIEADLRRSLVIA
jgi:hypothetical protein